MFYIEVDGNPMKSSVEEWELWLEGADRVIAQTKVSTAGVLVSTIFLGLDCSFEQGPPLIYETMIFGEESNALEFAQCRYSTREEARLGHDRIVSQFEACIDAPSECGKELDDDDE